MASTKSIHWDLHKKPFMAQIAIHSALKAPFMAGTVLLLSAILLGLFGLVAIATDPRP